MRRVGRCGLHLSHNKEQLHRHGFPFPGHTEFLRELTGAEDVVMMLAGPSLKVALATIHESLADVPGLLTKELLHKVIRITVESMLRDFGMKSPRIAVAGLNPHAGEAGKFGREEIEVIRPVIEQFETEIEEMGRHKTGFYPRISGPWPPDTVFHRAVMDEFDAVVAMYHDQGLIPVKLAHFNDAVNVSLGLPIVRTSVDHGTAYDIAGTGTADPEESDGSREPRRLYRSKQKDQKRFTAEAQRSLRKTHRRNITGIDNGKRIHLHTGSTPAQPQKYRPPDPSKQVRRNYRCKRLG